MEYHFWQERKGGLVLYRKSNVCITGKGLRVLSPKSYIHVSLSDLYISRNGPQIWQAAK